MYYIVGIIYGGTKGNPMRVNNVRLVYSDSNNEADACMEYRNITNTRDMNINVQVIGQNSENDFYIKNKYISYIDEYIRQLIYEMIYLDKNLDEDLYTKICFNTTLLHKI